MKSNINTCKKIKFYFERKSLPLLLWILTILFSILAIKSSNEPIFTILQHTVIEKYLYQFDNSNNFIWDISIGFIISVIFYVIVVYIPESLKKKDIEPFINAKCQSIILSSHSLIKEIINKSNLNYEYKSLTSEQLMEVCKSVNPKLHLYLFHSGVPNITQNHLGYKTFNQWTRITTEIDNLIRLLPYVDSGLLKRIFIISNNALQYTSKDLANIELLKNNDLESWSSTFYNLYLETKDLRDYYILYSNSDFKNDPWK